MDLAQDFTSSFKAQPVMLASDSVDNLPIKEMHNKFSCSLMGCSSYHGLSLGV